MFQIARWRLVAWNVVVLGMILVVLGILFYTAFVKNVYAEVDDQLTYQQTRAIQAIRAGGIEGGLASMNYDPSERGYYFMAASDQLVMQAPQECSRPLFLGGPCPATPAISKAAMVDVRQVVQRQIQRQQQVLLPSPATTDVRTVWWRGVHFRVRTFAVPLVFGGYSIVQIARDMGPERGSIDNIRTLLIYGSILGLLFSASGSLFLANRALVPIREAFARQQQFTADASHELRTPLSLIRANAEMLTRRSAGLPLEDQEMAREIVRETDHLNRMVTDMLALARADTGIAAIEPKTVDLRTLAESVHEDIRPIAETRGIQSDVSLNGPVSVNGDEVRLRQLLLILLDNAFKYTDPGGAVRVGVERRNDHAWLTVSDTGIGIPAEDLPHVFERFYRVDRAREHESGGTGLGLAIAQWIVEAHGGTITAESEPGEGTSFTIALPVPPG